MAVYNTPQIRKTSLTQGSAEEVARLKGGEQWQQKTPNKVTALQSKKNVVAKSKAGKVNRVHKTDNVQNVASVEAIDNANYLDDGQYIAPAVRLSIQRGYSPAESDLYDFCRPQLGDQDKLARKVFDDPNAFGNVAHALTYALQTHDEELSKRIKNLLQEDQMALELVQGYKNALVFS